MKRPRQYRRPGIRRPVVAVGGTEFVKVEAVTLYRNAIATVLGDVDPDTLGARIVEAAATLIDADQVVYGSLDAAGEINAVVQLVNAGGAVGAPAPVGADAEDPAMREELRALARRAAEHDTVFSERSALVLPIRFRGQLVGILRLARSAGPPFDDNAVRGLVALSAPIAFAIAHGRSFEIGRRREHWLETLAAVVTALLSGGDLSDVLPTVVRQARAIVDADGAAVALPSVDGAQVTVRHPDGFGVSRIADVELPTYNTLVGKALLLGTTLQVDELATDARVEVRHGLVDIVGPAVYVPLGTPSAVHGVLFVYNRLGGPPFDSRAVDMLNAFAAQVAVALELAERRDDATMIALFEDRERIARDLHDVVIQRLFATGLTLEGASRWIADVEAGRRVSRAIDDLDQTIKEIRATIFGLQAPAGPAYSSLRARVVGVVDQEIHALGFVPGLRFEGLIDTTVPASLADHVVAVLHEALSNVARHANASQVDVKVTATSTDLTVFVDDDGVGMGQPQRRSGLRNMENRAAIHGGRLVLRGRSPHGTRVEWTVPLRAPG